MERQVIWLRGGVATFTALCEECLAKPSERSAGVLGYRNAKVVGRLRLDADVGFTRCSRGHPISVRRIGRNAA
jgi:hypothetical protein